MLVLIFCLSVANGARTTSLSLPQLTPINTIFEKLEASGAEGSVAKANSIYQALNKDFDSLNHLSNSGPPPWIRTSKDKTMHDLNVFLDNRFDGKSKRGPGLTASDLHDWHGIDSKHLDMNIDDISKVMPQISFEDANIVRKYANERMDKLSEHLKDVKLSKSAKGTILKEKNEMENLLVFIMKYVNLASFDVFDGRVFNDELSLYHQAKAIISNTDKNK